MKLRPYQVEAAHWLVGKKRAYLADAPRVGKTPSVAEALRLDGATGALILCPAGVRTHWRNIMREVAPNVPHEVMSFDKVARGGEKLRDTLFAGHVPISHIVIDEAHHLSPASSDKAEEPSSARTKLILGKNGYAPRVPVVWLAGGTPMRRDVGSLWPMMASLFGDRLIALGIRTADDWYNRYTNYEWVPQSYGPPKRKVWSNKEEGKAELTQLLRSIMLRRTLEQIGMQVPPMSWVPLTLDVEEITSRLSPSELLGASRLIREWIDGKTEIDENKAPGVSVVRHELGLAKAPAVVDYAADVVIGENAQIVLFAHHIDVMDTLEAGLFKYGITPIRVDGRTPEKARWKRYDEFNAGKFPVFIGQNHAVKEGVPLHGAHVAVSVEPDWSATVNHQLSQRIVAVGQTERKMFQFASAAGTIDDAITRQHVRETEMQEVLGG